VILNFKNFFIIAIVCFGYYIFYNEYINIFILNLKFVNNQIYADEKVEKIKSSEISSDKIKNVSSDILNNQAYNKTEIIISKGDTFLSILKRFNLSDVESFRIINEIENYYNLKKLKIGDSIGFYRDSDQNLKKIEIFKSFDTIFEVTITDKISINIKELEKKSFQMSSEFQITNSLYSDGLKNNIPEDILIKLIKLFSFDLDFQRDIKKDTVVSISYEFNEIQETNKIKYNDIIYALILINDKKLEYFKFVTDDGYLDYFNREGKNVKKSILKTPLDGARLSSNFGMRKHPISGYNKMHKGVDFAAPTGTPIYAGGNGTIEYAGTNGGYGKYIRIRHNNEYKTAYAHLSGFKKGITKGARVSQGDVIGFVGNTGNSTGPHLHYEILYQNKHINPMKLKLPSGKILEGNELKRFNKEYKMIYANHLNLLYE
tara:strand:+ start:2273 stop:3565 length:1293 start_codon:yes stop_codon:yes gene_type:complete